MKTIRLNKPATKATVRINKRTRDAVKSIEISKTTDKYIEQLNGRTVILESLPTDVKRAKRLFKVGEKYKIEKPVKPNYINSRMAVHLQGADGNIYYISFTHWKLTAY